VRINWKDDRLGRAAGYAVIISLAGAALMLFWRFLADAGNILVQLSKFGASLSAVILPFCLSLVLAYVLAPLVRLIEEKPLARLRKKRPVLARGLAVLICYLLLLGLLALLLRQVVPMLMLNIRDFWNRLPGYLDHLDGIVGEMVNGNPVLSNPALSKPLENALDGAQNALNSLSGSLTQRAMQLARGTVQAGLGAFIALIGSIYCLMDGGRMLCGVNRLTRALLGERRAAVAFDIARIFDRVFGGYLRARLIDSLVVAAAVGLAFWAADIPFSALFAVINGVLNLVPFFGPILGWGITVFALALNDPMQAIWAAIIVLAVQQIDGYVVGPKIMGDSIDLRPLYVMLAISAGTAFFGLPGMLLAVPCAAVARALLSRFISGRLDSFLGAK
jgi:predicted PurR-regulated permease PerM